jgi:hypothetical protein
LEVSVNDFQYAVQGELKRLGGNSCNCKTLTAEPLLLGQVVWSDVAGFTGRPSLTGTSMKETPRKRNKGYVVF